MTKKIKFIITAIMVLAVLILGNSLLSINSPETKNIEPKTTGIKDGIISITYKQPVNFETSDLLANWAYIMASAINETSESVTEVNLQCEFDNGDKLLVTAAASDVIDFSQEKTTPEEFFSRVTVEPLTSGPEI